MPTKLPRILQLTLKKEFFDLIALGKKKTEYREYKPYWKTRLEGRKYDAILFRNGYGPRVPEMLVEFRGLRRDGPGRRADYAIRLGKVLEIRRWKA